MRHRRLFIGLLSAGTFLVQALGAAWAMPAAETRASAPQAVTAEAVPPCHGGEPAETVPTDPPQDRASCCGEGCTCAMACGVTCAVVARMPAVLLNRPDVGRIAASSDPITPGFSLVPLRPPIVS